ncbi:MAG: Glycerate dehydrogenase [Elusimicrobia bacterium]|nr:Glycerate dehydrogenase [Elusimicrobiota bacterium]
MKKPVVYVALQQFCETTQAPIAVMEKAGLEVRLNTLGRRVKQEEMAELMKDAQAVLAGVEPYDEALFSQLPMLKCISRCGIGTDAIDMSAAKTRGIQVFITIDEVVQPVAEMTVAMMLSLARNLPLHLADARAGLWKKHTGVLLSEWTVGLVGFGRIARAVARCLEPFQAHLVVSDPFLKPSDVPPSIKLVNFSELLAMSDVVSLHATRSMQEGYLMGEKEIAQMKPTAFLINTSRGYMVHEGALHKALSARKIAGAALDVYETEPYSGPLASLPNVICTPHVATLTTASRAAMELRAAQNIATFFQSKELIGGRHG